MYSESRVDNLAIRVGVSCCVYSEFTGRRGGAFSEYQVAPSGDSADKGTMHYNSILLEFSVNGIALTDPLETRL